VWLEERWRLDLSAHFLDYQSMMRVELVIIGAGPTGNQLLELTSQILV
jgi:hypothetical protein